VQNVGSGYFIRFKQKKTGGSETLPITEQAHNMLEKNSQQIGFYVDIGN
jgi:hypothetical protein